MMDEYDDPTIPDYNQGPTDKLPRITTNAPAKQRLSRRRLVAGGVLGVGVVAAAGIGVEEWLQHTKQESFAQSGMGTPQKQVGHLLRKAGFGATPADLQQYAALDYTAMVDRLLNYKTVSDDQLEPRLSALQLDFNKPADQQRWWLLRMAWTQRPLLEKMTLFWHGVLTSSYAKVGGKDSYQRMIVQNNFLRDHAFDTFDTIMLGITADPAMLFYLDLTKSRKNMPNENYAREMMELFTMGLGHYTQQDVSAAAASLTGWHVARGSTTSHYVPGDHSDATRTFLGQTGSFDYKDIVRIVTNNPATPWFICRKLFTFFAYENPSNADLQPLVDTYNKSNHNMGAVMRTLLLSPQFQSDKAYRSRIKSPAEYTAGVYRALDVQGSAMALPTVMTQMGQVLFNPPNVAGWPGDKVSAVWLNSGAWFARLNYINAVLAGNHNKAASIPALDLQDSINANHLDSPEHFVDHFTAYLLDGVVDPARRSQFIDYFNSSAPGQQVKLTNGKSYALSRARGTLYLILSSPEYQLS